MKFKLETIVCLICPRKAWLTLKARLLKPSCPSLGEDTVPYPTRFSSHSLKYSMKQEIGYQVQISDNVRGAVGSALICININTL